MIPAVAGGVAGVLVGASSGAYWAWGALAAIGAIVAGFEHQDGWGGANRGLVATRSDMIVLMSKDKAETLETGPVEKIKWLDDVADHDYDAAEAYLSLKFDVEAVHKTVKRLRKASPLCQGEVRQILLFDY